MECARKSHVLIAWVAAGALALSGCRGTADDVKAPRAVDLGSPVDAAAHAGDVEFRIIDSFAAGQREVPLALFLGLTPGSGTRLAANALIDLRALQGELPELLTGTLDPSCGLGLDVNFEEAEAAGSVIEARAAVDARLYRCKGRGTEGEARGGRLLTESIDVVARITGGLEGDCIAFRLEDLDLAPRGLVGRLASLFGVTERVRIAILAKARATLAENPVCPELPDVIAPLAPAFTSFVLQEIGTGGIGAAASGSVDLASERLLRVLAAAEASGKGAAGTARVTGVSAGRLDVRIDEAMTVRESELPYALDIGLVAVGPTRIGVEAMLDLRELQARLPDLLLGETLVDTCGGRVMLNRLDVEGREESLIARARLELETYECMRTGPGTWERGNLQNAEEIGVRAELSADLAGDCILFRLIDLARDPPGVIAQLDTGSGRAQAARALLLEAVGLILEESPLCPELPEELIVLDPSFDRGAPQEIGEGGVGVVADGSIEVSPRSVVDLLRLLQARGVVPPPP